MLRIKLFSCFLVALAFASNEVHSAEKRTLESVLLSSVTTPEDRDFIEKHQQQVIDWIISHKNPNIRKAACIRAGGYEFAGAIKNLRRALSDPEIEVVEAAGEALMYYKEADSISELIAASSRDTKGRNPWKLYNSLFLKMPGNSPLRAKAITELRLLLPEFKGRNRFFLITTLGSLGDRQIKDVLLNYDIRQELKENAEESNNLQEYYLKPAIEQFKLYESAGSLK